jgi:hypothetical protein
MQLPKLYRGVTWALGLGGGGMRAVLPDQKDVAKVVPDEHSFSQNSWKEKKYTIFH